MAKRKECTFTLTCSACKYEFKLEDWHVHSWHQESDYGSYSGEEITCPNCRAVMKLGD